MKTEKQMFQMYRDLLGSKCIVVENECVSVFVDYCFEVHGLVVNGGALSVDGKTQYLYID